MEKELRWEMDNRNAICPYCGNSYQVECEDYNGGGMQEECGSCEKTYRRWTEFVVTHHTEALPNAQSCGTVRLND